MSRCPESARLGEEGQAWDIVRTSLSLERVGIPRFALASRMLHRAVAALKKAGRFGPGAVGAGGAVRTRPARWRVCTATASSISAATASHPGRRPAPARFATVNAERLVSEFVVEHLPDALAGGDPMLLAHHQRGIVAGIASGAAEIQLNLIATELLRLPREPR